MKLSHQRLGAVSSLVWLSAMGGSGCAPAEGGGGASGKTSSTGGGVVALVGAGRDDLLFPVLQTSGGRFQHSTRGLRVVVDAPERRSPVAQAELIRALGSQGLRALCVQVVDAEAIRQPVESLRSAGVVVVTLGNPLESQPPFLHSGWNERQGGSELAEALADCLPTRGTLAVLVHDADETLRRRRQGFLSTVAAYPRFEILATEDCGGDARRAGRIIADLQTKYPGIDAWVTLDDWLMREFDRAQSPPREAVWVSTGLTADFRRLFQEGGCDALVVPDYDKMVTRALDMVRASLTGQLPPERHYDTPWMRITPETLADFEQTWAIWSGLETGRGSATASSATAAGPH